MQLSVQSSTQPEPDLTELTEVEHRSFRKKRYCSPPPPAPYLEANSAHRRPALGDDVHVAQQAVLVEAFPAHEDVPDLVEVEAHHGHPVQLLLHDEPDAGQAARAHRDEAGHDPVHCRQGRAGQDKGVR